MGLRWAGWDREIWTGGFPCQDISAANPSGAGLDGERSGLWWDWLRLIRASRPRRLLIENSSFIRCRGADEVLRSLEVLGYACWPLVVGAHAVGARHRRDRCWIVANLMPERCDARSRVTRKPQEARSWRTNTHRGTTSDLDVRGCQEQRFGVAVETRHGVAERFGWRPIESAMVRAAHGIPRRVDRIRGLGNSVVPQVVAVIARAWMKAEE